MVLTRASILTRAAVVTIRDDSKRDIASGGRCPKTTSRSRPATPSAFRHPSPGTARPQDARLRESQVIAANAFTANWRPTGGGLVRCLQALAGMTRITLHPDDIERIRRRLRTSGLLLIGITLTAMAAAWNRQVPRGRAVTGDVAAQTEAADDSSRGRSVPPTGWRRTTRGWERVSDWPALPSARPASLSELVRQQETREPAWARGALARLRLIPPLGFAAAQVVAIGVICAMSQRAGQSQRAARSQRAGRSRLGDLSEHVRRRSETRRNARSRPDICTPES